MNQIERASPRKKMSNAVLAAGIVGLVAIMLGAAYAAVPLYYAFCRATGYGGTPRIATKAPSYLGKRIMTVRFDTNVMPGLPWSFEPEVPSVQLRTGATATAFFEVTNHSNHPVTGQAGYNISPDQAAIYFNKIACFCFTTQTLAPGETREMPVVFFLDPALEKDETMNGINAVTLSYTFFPAKPEQGPIASAATRTKPKL